MKNLKYFHGDTIAEESKDYHYTSGDKFIVGEKVYYGLLRGVYDGEDGHQLISLKESELDDYEIEAFSSQNGTPHIKLKKIFSKEDLKKAFEDGSHVTIWSDMGVEMKYENFETWYKEKYND